jgi:cardiolipin synthase
MMEETVKLIPNLLSAARLALAPYIFVLLYRHDYRLGLALCFVAGISDALDGFIARRLHASSRLGAYLDPISDKVLLSGCFLTLALTGPVEMWLALLVFARDLLILLLVAAGFVFVNARAFPPSIWGKLSTAAQIAFVFCALANLSGFMPIAMVVLFKWIVAGLAVWSGLHYTWIAFLTLRENTRPGRDAAMMKL